MKRLDQLAAELEKVKAELAANRQKADAVEQRQQAAAPTATAAPQRQPHSPSSASRPGNRVRGANSAFRTAGAGAGSSTGAGCADRGRDQSRFASRQHLSRHPGAGSATHRVLCLWRNQLQPPDAQCQRGAAGCSAHGARRRAPFRRADQGGNRARHAVLPPRPGEAAVEQVYVEREFDNGLRAKAGLFLVPAGLFEPEPRADRVLRRGAQLRRNRHHPDHLARSRRRRRQDAGQWPGAGRRPHHWL